MSPTASITGHVSCAWKPCCRVTRNAIIPSVLEAIGPTRPEDCGGSWAYLQRVDQHHVPLNAMALVATAVESNVKQVISRRFCKKQRIAWTPLGAHFLLNPHVRVK